VNPDVVAQLLPILLLVVLLYLLVIRPARKRAQRVTQLQQALSVGDEVMLTSGIYGHVVAVEDDRLKVAIADGVVVTVHRGAIGQLVKDVPADSAEASTDPAAHSTLEERAGYEDRSDAGDASSDPEFTDGPNNTDPTSRGAN
jgi:preprotein translocase subunit YajC